MKKRTSRAWGWLLVGLAGCAGPRDHFYTLSASPGSHEDARIRSGTLLLSVRVPAAIDRAPLIVHTSPEQVLVLEHERWLGLPSEQLSATLGRNLETRRSDLWVGGAALADGGLNVEVNVDVVRMEVSEGHATLEARWRVSEPTTHTDAAGDALLSEPVGSVGRGDYAGVAAAFSRDVSQLADRIAPALPRRP